MPWTLVLLFTLLPIYLIRFRIGFLPSTVLEVLIWIIISTWLYKKIKHKKLWAEFRAHIILTPGLFIAVFVFLLGATVSTLLSPDVRAAVGEWRAFYIEPTIIFYILIDALRQKNTRDAVLIGLTACGLITALVAIYQHFTGWMVPHAFWANRNTYRVTGWYGFPNAVGMFLAPIVPIAFHLLISFYKKNKIIVTLAALYIPAALLAIFYSKTMGAIIGLLAGLGVYLLCVKKTRPFAIAGAVIGIIGLVLIPNSNPIKQEILAQDRSGQLRRDIWSETMEYLRLHPLRGAGMAAYDQEITPFRRDKTIEVFHHPHNIFLTMWVNTGLVGLIGFVGILMWFFATGWRTKNTLYITIAMVTVVVMGLVDSPYIKNDLAVLFWLIVGLMAAARLDYTLHTEKPT